MDSFVFEFDGAVVVKRSCGSSSGFHFCFDFIGPVFDEMVDKIVYTYKFTTLPNIDALKEECKIWLTTILDKYDPSKGSKAFSYFSVVESRLSDLMPFIHKIHFAPIF